MKFTLSKQICVFLFYLLFSSVLYGKIDSQLIDLIDKNKKGFYVYKDVEDLLRKYEIPKEDVYNYVLSKSDEDVLFFYNLLFQEISITQKLKLKQEDVLYLINKGLDSTNSLHVYSVVKKLLELPNEYFNKQSKTLLSSILLKESVQHYKSIIRLSGKLNIDGLIPYYESRLQDDNIDTSTKWNIELVLGRMGDLDKVKSCLKKVQQFSISDQVIYNLIPDLLYLHNRFCYDYILQQILVDNINCTSTDPDSEVKITCAYRLIEMIAPYIKDFPIELYESGDIVTDDYERTLLEVRNWILQNNYLYELKEI